MKLGAGNAAPALVGSIALPEGQARLSLSVIDPKLMDSSYFCQ